MAAQRTQNRDAPKYGAQTSAAQPDNLYKNGYDQATRHNHASDLRFAASSAEPSARNGERTSVGWDQNPELLQWRANVLLDEMMLGAVDITASESVHSAPAPARPMRPANAAEDHTNPHWRHRRPAQLEDDPSLAHPTDYTNGVHPTNGSVTVDSEPRAPLSPPLPIHEEGPHDEWSRPAWHFAEPTAPVSTSTAANVTPTARAVALHEQTRGQTAPATPVGRNRNSGQRPIAPDLRTAAVGAPPLPRSTVPTTPMGAPNKSNSEQWVFAAEQRYQQIASRHQPVVPEHGAGLRNGISPASIAAQGWADPAAALLDGFATGDYANGADAMARPSAARQRLSQAARRSNLLPRMSNLDPRALQQEMVMLQTEIEGALPAGHESRERALHLLQKAYTILQTDATRSAEVDYYLQQVRTIGQRVQETLHWSNLYQSRLTIYLVAWGVLSLIVLGGGYFYYDMLLATIAGLSGADVGSESLLAYNLVTAASVFFAGCLGGAIGAFVNMRQYGQVKQGFFDRKYSLRGLILPLIGGLVGLILSLLFGLIYYLLQLDPAVNLLLGALPALFAFAFGVAQEFIYGTRS